MTMGMTKKELADISGYTYRRLHEIDGNLPDEQKLFVQSEDGKYDLTLFVKRWVDYNVQIERNRRGAIDLDIVKAQHEVVKTEKTQLEVDRMRGQLIDVQDVKRLWGDIANSVMQNLIHVPSKVAPLVQMMDSIEAITRIIDDEIRKALNDIADTPLPAYAAHDESEEEDDMEV